MNGRILLYGADLLTFGEFSLLRYFTPCIFVLFGNIRKGVPYAF